MASRRLPLSWILGSTALALAVAAAVVLLFGGGDDDSADGEPASNTDLTLSEEGDLPASVHDVVLADIEGDGERPLHELMDGKPIVLNFFASWCAPCIEEMPVFERVHQAVGDQVNFVGLALTDRSDNALDIIERTGVTYPTFADPEGSAMTYFGGTNMPTTVFLAESGAVLDVVSTPLDEQALRDRLVDLYGMDPAAGGG